MNIFDYMGHAFVPYGNVIGTGETGYQRAMNIANTVSYVKPLLSQADGYSHEEFYNVAGDNAVDIYYLDGMKPNMFGEIDEF